MTSTKEIVAALTSDLCVRKTLDDGTGVVVDLESSRVLALNTTGMFLVDQLLEGTESVDDLIEALCASFLVDRATAERDVPELLEELRRHLLPPRN